MPPGCTGGEGQDKSGRLPSTAPSLLTRTSQGRRAARAATGTFCHLFELSGTAYIAVVSNGAMRVFPP